MSDERLRELQRRWQETGASEDEVAFLFEKVRTGSLARNHLLLAAYLGHDAARTVLGTGAPEVVESPRHTIEGGRFTVVVVEHPSDFESSFRADLVVEVNDSAYRASSRHLMVCLQDGLPISSCVIAAGGGTTGVHAHSAALHEDTCYLAAGDQLLALKLPQLELAWSQQADDATCFGVHLVSDPSCLIVHGELSISRISLSGEVAWRVGGADIFTGDFLVEAAHVVATDFNAQRYRIALEDGQTTLLPSSGGHLA